MKFNFFLLIVFFCSLVKADQALVNYDKKMIIVKVAESEEEKKKGFMFINEPENFSGILFLYNKPKIVNFWMKNTYLDLIIIFIDNNKKIIQIEKGERLNKQIISSSKKVIAVLELPFECSKKIKFSLGKYINWKKIHKNNSINVLANKQTYFSCS